MPLNKFAASSAILLALAVLSTPVKITAVVAPYDAGDKSRLYATAPDAFPCLRDYYDGFDPHLSGLYGPYRLGTR